MTPFDGLEKAAPISIKMIKKRSIQEIPDFWITDWLLHVINQPSSFLFTDEHYQLTESELARFDAGVTQMQQGIPLAYLTGQQEFWSLDFKVNEHTLIPRPDTEVLVEQVLLWIQAQSDTTASNQSERKHLLDLGTGSGCIAISLAHELRFIQDNRQWQVVAIDVSKQALEVARYNATVNKVPDIEFVQSSWYDALPSDTERFDVIVSNPPYIDAADEHLSKLKAEPISALSAPNQGLADIEYIVERAPQYLKNNGLLAIEHGFNQGASVRQLFLDSGFKSVTTIQDYGSKDRVTLGQLTP